MDPGAAPPRALRAYCFGRHQDGSLGGRLRCESQLHAAARRVWFAARLTASRLLQLSALNEKNQAPVTAHQGQLLAQRIKDTRRARARGCVSRVAVWRSGEVRGVLRHQHGKRVLCVR